MLGGLGLAVQDARILLNRPWEFFRGWDLNFRALRFKGFLLGYRVLWDSEFHVCLLGFEWCPENDF